jgi:predicted metal-dependent hydrolase
MAHSVRTIELDGRVLHYTIHKRRTQRHLTLSIRHDGTVRLTIPTWVSYAAALDFIHEKYAWLAEQVRTFPTRAPEDRQMRHKHYREYKERTRTLVHARLREINEIYGFRYGRVSIRSTNSRWGSCSAAGNLNFDYRILFLPDRLRDYILVHELCHVQELNHGARFWELVARHEPDHQACRAALRVIDKRRLGITAP